MEMTLRWYGPGYDSVTLEQIRQVPGVTGVITTLYGTKPGEAWKAEDIRSLKKVITIALRFGLLLGLLFTLADVLLPEKIMSLYFSCSLFG